MNAEACIGSRVFGKGKRVISVEVMRPDALDASCIGAWRAMQAATPAFANPLLGPEFAIAVGAVRQDAHIAVWRDAGAPVAFLAHHRRPGGFARPIGAPFSDYCALISGPGFPLSGLDALESAGIAAMQLDGLADPYGLFSRVQTVSEPAYRIRRGDVDAAPALTRNQARNAQRYRRKIERDIGPLRLQAPDHDGASFDALMGWKSQQLNASGLHDVLAPVWTRTLMQALFERRAGPLQGLLIMLYAGDRPVAGHFGVRTSDVYHPWIAALDSELGAYSPGTLHLRAAIEAMPQMELSTYDLGPGSGQWKAHLSNDVLRVRSGLAATDTPEGRRHAAKDQLWTLPVLSSLALPARLHRRLDVIAASEITTGARLAGVVTAVAGMRRQARRHAG